MVLSQRAIERGREWWYLRRMTNRQPSDDVYTRMQSMRKTTQTKTAIVLLLIATGAALVWWLATGAEHSQEDWQRGFDWADRQQLSNASDCELLDSRYSEGCRGYVEDGYGPIGERRTGRNASLPD